MDNSGENKALANEIKQAQDLCSIQIEFTPPRTPQYNGKVERHFQTFWGRTRALLNGAQLPGPLRHGLWAEAARHTTILHNHLVTPKYKYIGTPYRQFYNKDWKGFVHLHRFGFIGVVNTTTKPQSKLKDKGTPMLYLGPTDDHAGDVHRMFNPTKRSIVESRDVDWLNKSYGVWKGLIKPTVQPALTPPEIVPDDPTPAAPNEQEAPAPDPDPAPAPTPAPTPPPNPTANPANRRLLRAMN